MAELKDILANITKAIVDQPDEVVVEQSEEAGEVLLTLHVAPDDMGKVIGRHGKIAKAIRAVMKAAANTVDRKVRVDIADVE